MVRKRLKCLCFAVALVFQATAAADVMGWQMCHLHSGSSETPSGAPLSHAVHGFDDHSELGISTQSTGPCNCDASCEIGSTLKLGLESYGSEEPALFDKASVEFGSVAQESLPGLPSYLLPYAQAPPSSI